MGFSILIIDWYAYQDSLLIKKLSDGYTFSFDGNKNDLYLERNTEKDTLHLKSFFEKLIQKNKANKEATKIEDQKYETAKHKVFLKNLNVNNGKIDSWNLMVAVKEK